MQEELSKVLVQTAGTERDECGSVLHCELADPLTNTINCLNEGERLRLEDREEFCELLSSGRDTAIAFLNSATVVTCTRPGVQD